MAVEPWFTGTAAVTAAVAPVVLIRGLRVRQAWAFALSIPMALAVSELVFRFVKPDFHYGPLYGLGVVMNGLIAIVIAAVVTALLKVPSKP